MFYYKLFTKEAVKMNIIDARNKPCPKPVMMVKKQWKQDIIPFK